MQLNLQEMTRRNGCFPGLEWWQATFGDSHVDYQDVLNKLAAEDRVDWARWLMHEVGAPDTLWDVHVSSDITDSDAATHAFFAGSLTVRNFKISGVLLVAGRLQANNIVAQSVIAGGGIEADQIDVVDNIVCTGGSIWVKELDATNIRSGDKIIADKIWATGTVRAVTQITCPQIKADSVVEYCTGLKPHKPRVGAAKTGHAGR